MDMLRGRKNSLCVLGINHFAGSPKRTSLPHFGTKDSHILMPRAEFFAVPGRCPHGPIFLRHASR
jgi:hypothetical protein